MTPKKRLGEMLMDAGVIGEAQLKAALGHQRQWGVRIGQALVDLKLATEPDIVRALSMKFGFEVAQLDELEPYALEQALKLLPREFALRHNVLPMGVDTGSITVAMSDPTNLAVVDEIRFRSGRRVRVCIGGDREIAEALRRRYPAEGEVEAIALDLDVDDGGEALHDPFGGGSKDDLAAFFSTEPGRTGPELPAARAPSPPVAAPGKPAPAAAPRPASPAPAAPAVARVQLPAPLAPPRNTAQPPASAAGGSPLGRASPARPPSSGAPPGTPPRATAPAPLREATGAPASPAPARAQEVAPAPAPARVQEVAAAPGGTAPTSGRPAAPALARLEDEITGGEPLLATDLVSDDEPGGRSLTADELAVLESLDRLASGAPVEAEVVKPAQAMAALVRLLLRKRIIREQELLEELVRK